MICVFLAEVNSSVRTRILNVAITFPSPLIRTILPVCEPSSSIILKCFLRQMADFCGH
jgi:hypothetical protein